MTEQCEHITKCLDCAIEICSFCVEDCSGCQEERCKECYLKHQTWCDDCMEMVCPKEIVMLDAIGETTDQVLVPQVCPICDMKNE